MYGCVCISSFSLPFFSFLVSSPEQKYHFFSFVFYSTLALFLYWRRTLSLFQGSLACFVQRGTAWAGKKGYIHTRYKKSKWELPNLLPAYPPGNLAQNTGTETKIGRVGKKHNAMQHFACKQPQSLFSHLG
jgi:hypothetical protein